MNSRVKVDPHIFILSPSRRWRTVADGDGNETCGSAFNDAVGM